MQTKEGENKWPNQYEVSSEISKNKDKVLKVGTSTYTSSHYLKTYSL